MAIVKVLVIGNWDLCLTIVNALSSEIPRAKTTILTYPSQTLALPPQVACAIVHSTSDFTPASLQSAFQSQDIVINTASGGDFVLQTRIIDAAIAAGVQRFMPHEFGFDSLNSVIQSRITKYAGRARVIEYLRGMESKGLQWVGISTGYTLDTALINGDLGIDMEWQSATMHGSGHEEFAVSSLEWIGRVVVSVVQRWVKVKNQYVYVAGCVTSTNEVLGHLERVLDRTFGVGRYEVEDAIKEGTKRIERGDLDRGVVLLERSVLYDRELNGVARFEEKSVNKMLELEEESVEKIVDKAVHKLKDHGKAGCGCA